MMATTDIDLTLYFRKKHTPPPSVLLLTVPNDKTNKDPQVPTSPFAELRSRQQKTRQITSQIRGLNTNNSDMHDSSLTSYGWQRHTDKIAQVAPAPDVAYRNTYLEDLRREKSATTTADYRSYLSTSRSPSPRSQHSQYSQQQQQQQSITRIKTASSTSNHTSDSLQRKSYQQYRTVYEYIRESIKQIERQRNVKQKNFSTRIRRPQNDDATLRRVLAEKKSSGSSKTSPIFKNDSQDPQNLVNYINHSREQIRVLHTTTPNQVYHSSPNNQKYIRQRTNLSQNQNDSLDNQQSLMMTATTTVGNS